MRDTFSTARGGEHRKHNTITVKTAEDSQGKFSCFFYKSFVCRENTYVEFQFSLEKKFSLLCNYYYYYYNDTHDSPLLKHGDTYSDGHGAGRRGRAVPGHGGVASTGGPGVIWHGLAWGGTLWVSLLAPGWLEVEQSRDYYPHSRPNPNPVSESLYCHCTTTHLIYKKDTKYMYVIYVIYV